MDILIYSGCRFPMCSQILTHTRAFKTDIFLHAQSADTCNMVTTSFKERPTDSKCPHNWGAKDLPL